MLGVGGPVPTRRLDQLVARGDELVVGDLVGGRCGERACLGERDPLPCDRLAGEPDLGGDLGEAGVPAGVAAGEQLPHLGFAPHQVVAADGEPAGGDQPIDEWRGLAGDCQLLVDPRGGEPIGVAEPAAHRARRVDHAGVDPQALAAQVDDEHLHQPVAAVGGGDAGVAPSKGRGAHRVTGSRWTSSASLARAYSPASQSLARCR